MNNEEMASREMPKYQCHKKVWALKIKSITKLTQSPIGLSVETSDPNAERGRVWEITPDEEGYAPFRIDEHYISKHNPTEGGYYVVYDDGYKSFSPAEAFESGYALI